MVSIGEKRNTYRILLQKRLGKPKGSLEDNVEMNHRAVGCADGRCVGRVMIVSNGELRR
jgi:hypothetical protein